MELAYKRVSLKLSGEALLGENSVIDVAAVERVAEQIKRLNDIGVEVGVTIGGGNIMRGRSAGRMERNRADHMGMLATAINSLALEDALIRAGVKCMVMSSVDMTRFCEPYTSRGANDALSRGIVVIFACGSGLPFVSTDTAAALKAAETGADALLLAKNVDAVYSADPKLDRNAVRYSRLSYDKVIKDELHATDLTAITLCKERSIPIIAFAMSDADNVVRAVMGESVGTLIADE